MLQFMSGNGNGNNIPSCYAFGSRAPTIPTNNLANIDLTFIASNDAGKVAMSLVGDAGLGVGGIKILEQGWYNLLLTLQLSSTVAGVVTVGIALSPNNGFTDVSQYQVSILNTTDVFTPVLPFVYTTDPTSVPDAFTVYVVNNTTGDASVPSAILRVNRMGNT